MENSSQLALIGVFKMAEAEKIRGVLEEKGLKIIFNHNKQTCTTGCATTVEVLTDPKNINMVIEYFKQEKDRILSTVDYDVEQIEQIFDPTKSEATCPACGAVFSTSNLNCPDCGLAFG